MRKPLLFALAAACSVHAQDAEIRLVRVTGGLTNPIDIQSARDGSGRLFVVQQNGLIRILRDGALTAAPFLDIRARTRASSECGLLGLAFPPQYAERRAFYVNYTTPTCNESIVARYRLGASGDEADANSEQIILRLSQPFSNHNGGGLAFGPDGFLYIGFGDGGSGGDPQNHGQTNTSLLGKFLRLDTETGSPATYTVPASNPFVGDSRYRPEIWSTGVRNPWRFSFDRETGDLWFGDVGQNRAEEIDFQSGLSRGGENYGWRLMEGLACFNPAQNCNRAGLTLPVHEYTRGQGDVSVTGGNVYRGSRWPSLRGTYVYGDYATGRIWGLRREGPLFNNRLLLDAPINISSFGEDEDGEIYVASHGAGEILRIEAAEAPRFTSRSVANAASFDLGLTPGSAAVVFAGGVRIESGISAATAIPLPRVLDGVRVSVNGADAPLFAVANVNGQEQVNFQAPWQLNGATATVIVSRNGLASPAVDIPVAAIQPGIFETNGEAIVVRAAGNTLVTGARPLRAGEDAYFYATGLGSVSPAVETGAGGPRSTLARTTSPVSVTLDGVDCEVSFAGLAPDLVGVYQVNFRAPAAVRSGSRALAVSVSGTRNARPVSISVE